MNIYQGSDVVGVNIFDLVQHFAGQAGVEVYVALVTDGNDATVARQTKKIEVLTLSLTS